MEQEGLCVQVRKVEGVTFDEMKAAHGIIVGNPARMGGTDWQLKRLFDVTAYPDYPGPLAGKIAGVFSAGSRPGSGAELALMATIITMLNHGMVFQGNAFAAHYGPILLRETSQEDIEKACNSWARLWSDLARKLFPEA